MNGTRAIDPGRLFLAVAGAVTLWLLATFLWHFTFGAGRQLQHILFLDQDFPALLVAICGLVLLSPVATGKGWALPAPGWRIVVPLIALAALWSWAGHYLVLQDYVLSRDEEVARFASSYMRDGLIARPIPPEWVDYRRALMPEFFTPYGATSQWAAAYLPVNSAIGALFWRLGDPNLAGPVLLGIGLTALWRVALRIFPGRPEAVWVALLLAFTSAQLSVTAMTPYAMTGHFALNMLWLALFLRGGWWGHGLAGLVALAAAGLHQWHFPPLFIGPFLFWLMLQRRWGVFAFHLLVLGCIVLLWAKIWPHFLLTELGPPADIRPTAGVGDKVGSLFTRLGEKWQPLTNITRMLAWNNVLLLPLAVLGGATLRWRDTVALPLALGCVAGLSLALAQGYGWGFRYGHGFIGPLCLLAGYGWQRVNTVSLRPIWLSAALALTTAAFLTVRAHDYVAPYAASNRLIQSSAADVVLVDTRGGMFVSDLVRSGDGRMGRPLVMNLGMLTMAKVEALCRTRDVALFDWRAFRALGVPPARWFDGHVAALRGRMAELGCGRGLSGFPCVDGRLNIMPPWL